MVIETETLISKLASLDEGMKKQNQLLEDFINTSKKQSNVIGMDEVSQLTGYTKNTIYQYVNRGLIPSHKPEHGGRKLIFFRAEIEDWLKGKKPETSEEYCERKELELYNSMKGGLN